MIPLALGAAAVTGLAYAWRAIPYSHPMRTGNVTLTRYTTILTQGVHVRGRVAGRLYAADFWREHGNTNR